MLSSLLAIFNYFFLSSSISLFLRSFTSLAGIKPELLSFTWFWVTALTEHKVTPTEIIQALSSCIHQPARSHSILLCSHPGSLPALSMYLWLQDSTNSSTMHPNLSLHNFLLLQCWGSHIYFQSFFWLCFEAYFIYLFSSMLLTDARLFSPESLIFSMSFFQWCQSTASTWWQFPCLDNIMCHTPDCTVQSSRAHVYRLAWDPLCVRLLKKTYFKHLSSHKDPEVRGREPSTALCLPLPFQL